MSQIVLDIIATETAKLARLEPTPLEPFGYGVDTSGVTDVTDTLDEVDAYSPLAIAQALLRRLITPRGTLPDDRDYGLDLRGYVNRGSTLNEIRDLESMTRGEVLKDDRVDDARVTVTLPSPLTRLRVAIQVTPVDPRTGGPFSLTLAVTSSEAIVEAVNANA